MSKDDVGEGAVPFGLGIIVALLLALSGVANKMGITVGQ